MKKGIFIVITGVNGTGKTTQIQMLREYLSSKKHGFGLVEKQDFEITKYAHYNEEPYGVKINEYLRKGNPDNLTPTEFQMLQVLERKKFQTEKLSKWLEDGKIVLAEDYILTGFAWGCGAGVSFDFLVKANWGLIYPDICIVLDGEPFHTGKERNHKHESDDELMKNVRRNFVAFSTRMEYSCPVIDSNRNSSEVGKDIVHLISTTIKSKYQISESV